jgi:hypothetical protein
MTPSIRATAHDLSLQINAYRAQQAQRVDRINQEYRESFDRLMDAFAQLSDAALRQGRDGDAQRLTDQIVSDDKALLIGQLRSSFAQQLQSQRDAITAADAAVAATRDAYLKTYTDAKLDLAKLQKVQSNLDILATKEDGKDVYRNAITVVNDVVAAHDELKQKAADASGQKTPNKPAPQKKGA